MTAVLLTTTDNPYDVVNDYQNWFQYDVQAGYNTCEFHIKKWLFKLQQHKFLLKIGTLHYLSRH